MTNMATDAPLTAHRDGVYTGVDGTAPMWARNPSIVASLTPTPLPVQVVNDCTAPVLTEACSPELPVETSMAQLGIIKDPTTGEPIGRVMVGRVTDELTGAVTETITAYYEDGTIVQNYGGPWAVEGDCTVSTPEGVLPSWG